MRRLYQLVFIFVTITTAANAQQTLNGRVFEYKTRVPLAGIKIENTRSKQISQTDINGRFSIEAALNDILVLNSFAYHPDTVLVIKLPEAEFFMLPRKNLLDEVKVTGGQEFTGSLKVYDRGFQNQTVRYATDDKGNYKGGI